MILIPQCLLIVMGMIFQPITFVGEIYRVVIEVLDEELHKEFAVLKAGWVQLHGRREVDLD